MGTHPARGWEVSAVSSRRAAVMSVVPDETVAWLTTVDNPAVSVLTRRTLLGEGDSPKMRDLWGRRNDYAPVRAILDAQREDGSWLPPERDYKKYEGSLWQVIFLGEMWANEEDERVGRAIEYALSRQLDNGAWSPNGKASAAGPCLTANVGRALARMGLAGDERIVRALAYLTDLHRELGFLGCRDMADFALNGYCHMLAPKILLFLAEVPGDAWPRGARGLRDACVRALRDKQVFRSLPREFKEFQAAVWSRPRSEMAEAREHFLAEHEPLHYDAKSGWLRFGFPLSYNSDALEALAALMGAGEGRRPEYEPAIAAVEGAADDQMRWKMRNSFNGKMLADVEAKGQPSKWLTLRALQVLEYFGSSATAP